MKTTLQIVVILSAIILVFCLFSLRNAQAQLPPEVAKLVGRYEELIREANNGHADSAIRKLNDIINLDFKSLQQKGVQLVDNILVNRYLALWTRGSIRLHVQGFYNEALRDFNEAEEMFDPLKMENIEGFNLISVPFHQHKSTAFYMMGNYVKAIDRINEIFNIAEPYKSDSLNLTMARLYSERGKFYSANKEMKKAVNDFRKAIALGSSEDHLFWGFAYVLHQIGQKENARFFFRKVSLNTSATDSHYLEKPISLKTKAFISKRLIVASNYISISADTLETALIYLKAYSGESEDERLILDIQKYLTILGYDPGPINGAVGRKTRSAIRQFQTDYKIPVDGEPTDELFHRLRITPVDSPKLPEKREARTEQQEIYQSIPKLVKQTLPAIVTVISYDIKGKPLGIGSGFFIEKSLIITNFHVIDDASFVKVKPYDGKIYEAKIIFKDESHDLAIIKLDDSYQATKELTLNFDLPRIGEHVLVIGHPLGLEQTVSDGIISGIRKKDKKLELIQITAPISSGSSGGPVLNLKGEVIGVATLYLIKGQNLNFAVSSKHLSRMIDKIKAEPAQVRHLGVSEKSATYKLHEFNFKDIPALEGMWAKRGVALNGSVTIVMTGQGSNLASFDFAYEVRRDESRNDPEYIKKVTIIRTGMILRFLTNILGKTLVNGEFASHIGSVLGMVREKWGNSWSAKFGDKMLFIFSDSNRDVIHVTVMPSY